MARTPDRRLLGELRKGLSLSAACAKLGVKVKEIEASSAKFRAEVRAAEAAGEAFIEATLLERGIEGDSGCLRMALERRDRAQAARDALGSGLENLTAAERDAVRRLVEQALAGKVADAVADLNPVEREQRLLAVREALEGDGVTALPVVRLVPVEGAQSAEPAAEHPDTGQAAVAAPGKPEADVAAIRTADADERAARAEEARLRRLGALDRGPVRDRNGHLVYEGLPARGQPGPDRSSERRGPVIAPHEWSH